MARSYGNGHGSSGEANPASGFFPPPEGVEEEVVMSGGAVQMGRPMSPPMSRRTGRTMGRPSRGFSEGGGDSNPASRFFPAPEGVDGEVVMQGGAVPAGHGGPDLAIRRPSRSRQRLVGSASAGVTRPFRLRAAGRSLSDEAAAAVQETTLLDETIVHEDPSNFPINLPEMGSDDDKYDLNVPDGLRLAYVDLEVIEATALAKAEVTSYPRQGATGRQRVVVAWSHPPYGKVKYRLRALASPDGWCNPVLVKEGPAGVEDRVKLLTEQDAPMSVLIRGPRARIIYEAIRQKQQEQGAEQQAVAMELVTIIVGLAIVVVIALVIMLGFMVLYAVLTNAMSKGYDIKDTKYKAAAGEGASRQEHELLFNLTKPPSEANATTESTAQL